jgi:NAD(P)-dependent dehydrogenase (short-subunit alcohol dehydrogenase family)
MQDLHDKVAFITGGDSGIGRGIVRALLGAGMKVAMTYRTEAHLQEAMEVLPHARERAHAIKLDVTDRPGMMAAAAETVRVFGKVHVLVNNAGVAPVLALSDSTFDDWDWCMSVNVDGVFNGIRVFLPYIEAHGEEGHILATSSMLGGLLAGPLWGAYSASKFAVVGMMEALRAELAHTNIGVSIFCPAGVKSSLGSSNRNRPATLADAGTADGRGRVLLEDLRLAMQRLGPAAADSIMDPTEAGVRVLRGILNNDLYIFSHAEYEQALRDRCELLLASIPKGEAAIADARLKTAQVLSSPMYRQELQRRALEIARRAGEQIKIS